MNDRITVDVDALRRGGVDVEATARLAIAICNDLIGSTLAYGNAGGTGEMGEMFDKNYVPTAERAVKFLGLLNETLGGASDRTVETSRSFEDAVGDANTVTGKI
ncbi:hypothetical protein ACRAKI_19980 [Saccharothrix isguenensis]